MPRGSAFTSPMTQAPRPFGYFLRPATTASAIPAVTTEISCPSLATYIGPFRITLSLTLAREAEMRTGDSITPTPEVLIKILSAPPPLRPCGVLRLFDVQILVALI